MSVPWATPTCAGRPCRNSLLTPLTLVLVMSASLISYFKPFSQTPTEVLECEKTEIMAYRRHNGIIAMQKTDGAMIGEQCHQLDVGYRMVDSPSERTVDMEKPRTVKPSDFEGG